MKLLFHGSSVGARHVVPLQLPHHQIATTFVECKGKVQRIREKSRLTDSLARRAKSESFIGKQSHPSIILRNWGWRAAGEETSRWALFAERPHCLLPSL
jgi:hypothetical protein